ncbi:nuclear transport factor 2 family protein [Clostridium sediminicola]|uniref:ester cyclase n=1 Tax=Clostridium sediminicola TaxID=3114879 RepID=UPI0031F1DEAC
MSKYQGTKKVIRNYFEALENSTPEDVLSVLKEFTSENYSWRGSYPYREQNGAEDVAEKFWAPLMSSLKHMQRRQDIFIGGTNELNKDEQWVMSMGHFMGLFDSEWLGIRPTGKMINLRYAEFNCVENGKITKSGIFIDIIGFMNQAGVYPLPPSTGAHFVYPGPRNHDGLLFEDAPKEEGEKTLNILNKMLNDIDEGFKSMPDIYPPEALERHWDKNMIWYGPAGIGATFTIPRYQMQHQYPFRCGLKDKKFNGHVCRFAEGNFACFFGWPNLTNTPIGGFMGLPGAEIPSDMQVVDVYCRQGDKLSENWVIIDIPYWLKQQGLDILERTQQIMNPKL